MLNFGFDWKSISRDLGKSGDKSPEMFNQLHSIFFFERWIGKVKAHVR